jgi:hypothetical protein
VIDVPPRLRKKDAAKLHGAGVFLNKKIRGTGLMMPCDCLTAGQL